MHLPKQSLVLCLLGAMSFVTRGVWGRRRPIFSNHHAKSIALVDRIRGGGGGGYFDRRSGIGVELNPNYTPPANHHHRGGGQPENLPHSSTNHYERYTLGADDDDVATHHQKSFIQTQDLSFTPSPQILSPSLTMPRLTSMWQTFCDFHRVSPSLARCLVACIVTFLSWQIPVCQPTLARWFVTSRGNVYAGRWPSLILSAISHSGLFHLIFNLASLLSFGPVVQQTLQERYGSSASRFSRFSSSPSPSSWPMWPLLLGSALAGSVTHLWLDPSDSGIGCMGLSSVTLGIMAVYTRLYPMTTLQVMLAGIIPVRLQAQTMLKCLLAWSVLGTLRAAALSMSRGKSSAAATSTIAHSAHLGGLLFGLAYYELLTRRFHVDRMMRRLKAQFLVMQAKQPK